MCRDDQVYLLTVIYNILETCFSESLNAVQSQSHLDLTPLSYTDYFDERSFAKIKGTEERFCYYTCGTVGETVPDVLFLLHHGAGHSALTWAFTAKSLVKNVASVKTPGAINSNGDILLGSGETASKTEVTLGVLAYDCRGHGASTSNDDTSLSLDQLTVDLENVYSTIFPKTKPKELVLVGHSLGGSVVVEACLRGRLSPKPIAVAVIDAVEGTAMEMLSHMPKYLEMRPSRFNSAQDAIAWSLKTLNIHNAHSARVSVPGQLKKGDDGKGFTWRVNLKESSQYWSEWFDKLSSKFLKLPAGKLLVLAGTDRLDKELTIGQMAGKYQLLVFTECSHSVQEDAPEKLSIALLELWRRNQPLVVIKKFPIANRPHEGATRPQAPH